MGYNENYGTVTSTKPVEPFNPKTEAFENSIIQTLINKISTVKDASNTVRHLANEKRAAYYGSRSECNSVKDKKTEPLTLIDSIYDYLDGIIEDLDMINIFVRDM